MKHPPVPQRSAKRGGPAHARARAAALSGLPSTLVTHLTRDNSGFVCGAPLWPGPTAGVPPPRSACEPVWAGPCGDSRSRVVCYNEAFGCPEARAGRRFAWGGRKGE